MSWSGCGVQGMRYRIQGLESKVLDLGIGVHVLGAVIKTGSSGYKFRI